MADTLRVTRLRCVVSLILLVLAACVPADLVTPGPGSVIDAPEASRLVLKVESTPVFADFMELEQVRIAASVLDASGVEIVLGDVEWSTENGFSIVPRGRRAAEVQLKLGTNRVRASFRTASGVLLQAQLLIEARAGKSIAVVWDTDGTITEIPQPSNVHALYPRAINDRGEVVGTAQFAVERRAFMWSREGGFRIIGPGTEDYSEGYDINNDGVVAGHRRIGTENEGFLWTHANGFVPVDATIDPNVAVGINKSGVVAGSRNYRAVRWSSEGSAELLALTAGGKCSGATAISASGHVIGWVGASFDDSWCLNWSPVIWAPDGSVHTIHACSHQLDCALQTTDVNGSGEVVGNNAGHPFRWTREGGFRDLLGDATGLALGINDGGEVAGSMDYPHSSPVIWDRSDRIRALPLPAGRYVGTAHAINNNGQAVGVVK